MAPLDGEPGVLVQECRLDEELVGAARELGNACDVRFMESGVDHVGDSVSARAAQRVLLEHAEGDGQVVADENPAVVRRSAPDRPLGFVQPSANRKLEQIEPLSPHIDPYFSWKAKARQGVPWSRTTLSIRNSSSSSTVRGGSGGIESSRRRNASRARNSQTPPTPLTVNSAAVSMKSSESSSRRFQL